MKMYAGKYATAWEVQIQTRWGGIWVGLRFPGFWMYRKARARPPGITCQCRLCRKWFFHTPIWVRLTDKEGYVK